MPKNKKHNQNKCLYRLARFLHVYFLLQKSYTFYPGLAIISNYSNYLPHCCKKTTLLHFYHTGIDFAWQEKM
jgi:hypothetical protein